MTPNEKCTIEGLVLEAGTDRPLRKARVSSARYARHASAITALTDPAGRFAILDLDPGHYTLAADCNGYVRQMYGQRDPAIFGPNIPICLEPGQRLRDIVFRLLPAAVITGRVLDTDGDPVAGANVQALRPTGLPGGPEVFPIGGGVTNDLGEYRIAGLPPGRYRLSANYALQSAMGPPPGFSAVSDDPATDEIELAAGAQVRGIDVTVRPLETFRIRGRVIDARTRHPVSDAWVSILQHRPGFAMVGGGGPHFTDEQGAFEIRGVTPGDYNLTASMQGAGKPYNAQLRLSVANADIDGIELALAAGCELRGHLRVEGDEDASLSGWHVSLYPREPNTLGVGRGGQVAPDGSFLFQGITPGPYAISTHGPPSDLYVSSIRLADKEVLATGFDLTEGIDPGALEITLSPGGGRIDGVVLDNEQKPAAGAHVMLVPPNSTPSLFYLHKGSGTDQNGRFTIRGIAPGDYVLCAFEDWRTEIARAVELGGVRCKVERASTQTVSLRVIPRNP